MSQEQSLIERLVGGIKETPSETAVLLVRQHSTEEMMRRARRMLAAAGDVCKLSLDRADWLTQEARTLIRLPLGGRAVVYHASGAFTMSVGLAPMEHLFEKDEPSEQLTAAVSTLGEQLGVQDWAGQRDSLSFERLWRIKAAAADRERIIEPVLCRVVGAFRQHVDGIPVLGAASVAIKVAGGGALDSFSVETRETTGEVVDWATILPPEDAAQRFVLELDTRMGKSKTPYAELIRSATMQFGYVSLGKRSNQMYLAPHYVAAIEIEGEEAQAYQFVVPASQRVYGPICATGASSVPAVGRQGG